MLHYNTVTIKNNDRSANHGFWIKVGLWNEVYFIEDQSVTIYLQARFLNSKTATRIPVQTCNKVIDSAWLIRRYRNVDDMFLQLG